MHGCIHSSGDFVDPSCIEKISQPSIIVKDDQQDATILAYLFIYS